MKPQGVALGTSLSFGNCHSPLRALGKKAATTVRPTQIGPLFQHPSNGDFCEPPSCSSHHKLFLWKLHSPTQSTKPPKWGVLSATLQGPTISVSIKWGLFMRGLGCFSWWVSLSTIVVNISGPRGKMPGRLACTGPSRRCAGTFSPTTARRADTAGRSATCHTRTGGGGVRPRAWKRTMPLAFGLYMAGGHCAHRNLRGITANARRDAVISLQKCSLWYTRGRACRPRERMYADSDGTGSRTRFIQIEGALYRMPCPSIQVRSTFILGTSDPRATASSNSG